MDATVPYYSKLGIKTNPFISIPPTSRYESDLRPLFSARLAEVEQICRFAGQPHALFLIAPYGGGKTVVMLEALSRIRERGITAVYASFAKDRGFRRSLCDGLRDLPGLDIGSSQMDPLKQIQSAIRELRRQGSTVVLAMDDLDRANDIDEVYNVTHDARDILAEGATMIVAGQPFGVTADLYSSAGGLFHLVEIPSFSFEDFREMLERYLSSVHIGQQNRFHPFDDAGASFICKEMSNSQMTPRLFNFAVFELIEVAVVEGRAEIPFDAVVNGWPSVAERVIRGLNPSMLRHLATIFRKNRVSEDTAAAINELGGNALAEFPDVEASVLRPLVEKNLVYARKVKGKDEYQLTPNAALVMGRIKPKPRRDRVFISYSHLDARLFKEFKGMLAPALQRGLVDIWDDTMINPGEKWEEKIEEALDHAQVGVLLVSANYLESEFISNRELPRLLDSAENDGATIYWVLLTECMHERSGLSKYQAAHDTRKPLDRLDKPNRQTLWKQIASRLLDTVGPA